MDRRLWFACAALLVCSCSNRVREVPRNQNESSNANVHVEKLPAPVSERYQVADNVETIQPIGLPENPIPRYPTNLLTLRLAPMKVPVRLVVNEFGVVTAVESLGTPPAAYANGFFGSVREACLTWKFSPLIQVTPGPDHTIDVENVGNRTSRTEYNGIAKKLPFHVDYVFTFTQTAGIPRVETEKQDLLSN